MPADSAKPTSVKQPWQRLREAYPHKASLLKLLLQGPLERFVAKMIARDKLPPKETYQEATHAYVADITQALVQWLRKDNQICDDEFLAAADEDLKETVRRSINRQLRRVSQLGGPLDEYRRAMFIAFTIARQRTFLRELQILADEHSLRGRRTDHGSALPVESPNRRGRKPDPGIARRRAIVRQFAKRKSDLEIPQTLANLGRALDEENSPFPARRFGGRPRTGKWVYHLTRKSPLRSILLETLKKDISRGKNDS